MTPRTRTREFVVCPVCDEGEFDVSHLARGKATTGPWHCPLIDCRTQIKVKRLEDGSIDVEHSVSEPAGLALLTMGGRYFVMLEAWGRPATNREADYLYHSHQCPTNLLGRVTKIYDPEHGADPHGIMRYVAGIERSAKTALALEAAGTLPELFALFRTDGVPAPSGWPESNGGVIDFIADRRRELRSKGDA